MEDYHSHDSQLNHLLKMAEEHVCQKLGHTEKMSSPTQYLGNNILKDQVFIPMNITSFLPLTMVEEGAKGHTAVWPLSLVVGPSHRAYRKDMWIFQRMEFP